MPQAQPLLMTRSSQAAVRSVRPGVAVREQGRETLIDTILRAEHEGGLSQYAAVRHVMASGAKPPANAR